MKKFLRKSVLLDTLQSFLIHLFGFSYLILSTLEELEMKKMFLKVTKFYDEILYFEYLI